jgi:hypothetical protein
MASRVIRVDLTDVREAKQKLKTGVEGDDLTKMLANLEKEMASMNLEPEDGLTSHPSKNDKNLEVSKGKKPAVEKPKPKKKEKLVKSSKPKSGEIVTVKSLATELGLEDKKLRKWLRSNIVKENGRWEWDADDPQLDEIRAKFRGKKK